ncbi:MAG TPA: chorismate mutase [Limnochordia bacterium]
MESKWRVRALRGATTVPENTREAIVAGARELTEAMIAANDLALDDIASVILTATPDLDAEFPAVGAREAGLVDVALLCAQELAVPGGPERCIRMLMHINTQKAAAELVHVYLHGAQRLRPDWARPLVSSDGKRQRDG